MLILTWNLFHGRAVPERPRSLQREFADALAGWDWDVALLQEVPPWWPEKLAAAYGAQQRMALTSRNWMLPVRRAIADRRPDLIKSKGGGCNAILVRTGEEIVEHRVQVLRRRPERRVVHGIKLRDGLWICNLHAQNKPHSETREDIALAGAAATDWADRSPIVIGGDFNIRDPEIPGYERATGSPGVDHVLARGVDMGRALVIDRGQLSDHVPVAVEVTIAI